MRATLARISAVAAISLREALRGGLPLLALTGMATAAGLVIAADAIDHESRRRLAVASVATCAALVAMLTAPLIAAVQLRRDLEQRAALTMFSRPLSRWGYLCGRVLGGMAASLLAAVATVAAGWLAIVLLHGAHPLAKPHSAESWSAWSNGGSEIDLAGKTRIRLDGAAGNAVRYVFADAHAAQRVVIRVRVQGQIDGVGMARLRMAALRDGQRIPLPIAAESPFPATTQSPDEALSPSRDDEHRDLNRDRVRVVVLPQAIAADGSLTIEIVRADAHNTIVMDGGSCELLVDDQWLASGLLIAVLMALAGGLFATVAAATVVPLGGIGVALLVAVVALVAGATTSAIADAVHDKSIMLGLRRLFWCASLILPDLGRITVGAELAAGRAVSWMQVVWAWWTVLPMSVVVLMGAWWRWSRVEP